MGKRKYSVHGLDEAVTRRTKRTNHGGNTIKGEQDELAREAVLGGLNRL